MHGFFFVNKRDSRNLMLQYGDTSRPLQKSLASVGTREIHYDSITDTLKQTEISLQY